MLRGLKGHKVRIVQGEELPKAMANASHLWVLELLLKVTDLLHQFHIVSLKPDTKPVNIKPYRYPLRQNNLIENW